MCATCGCSETLTTTITEMHTGKHFHLGHRHSHDHDHDHEHEHKHDHEHGHHHFAGELNAAVSGDAKNKTLTLEKAVLGRNQLLAERNRGWFEGRGILVLNLVSSPGAGKTTLLERTLRDLKDSPNDAPGLSVIEGDQSTTRDAERIAGTGVSVVQVNTGTACHLDAEMIYRSLPALNAREHSIIFIENVGNLVCPALFDLGEYAKILVASVTEGEDKPVKYPHMFREAKIILLNKVDLLPYVSFDISRFTEFVRLVNPTAQIFEVSATKGDGLNHWYQWIRAAFCGLGQKGFGNG